MRRNVAGCAVIVVALTFAASEASAQETDGFREHSGNRAASGFASLGWFGARDALKLTAFAGRSRMQLAYYAYSGFSFALGTFRYAAGLARERVVLLEAEGEAVPTKPVENRQVA